MENLQKKTVSKEKTIHWKSIFPQVRVWHPIMKRAALAIIEHDYNKYKDCVYALINQLHGKERELANNFKEEVEKAISQIDVSDLNTNPLETEHFYIKQLYEYTLDLIEPFIKVYHIPSDKGEEYETGHPLDIGDGDLDEEGDFYEDYDDEGDEDGA